MCHVDAKESCMTLSLDCLPFDCLVTICEYLSAEDLVRLSRTCSVFHEVTQVSYLWRRLSLSRWVFCNIHQISEGPQRWQRYFSSRRHVEAKMDTGKPLRDYRVRSLRGHETDIVCVMVVGERRGAGGDVNWENLSPPLVISLSSDGCVKAWDVMQGKAVWSLEGEHISCLTVCESRSELALGRADSSVQLWDVSDWSLGTSFQTNGSSGIATLLYGNISNNKSSVLPKTFLIVHTGSGQTQIWDPNDLIGNAIKPVSEPVKPVLELRSTPSHMSRCQLSSSHSLLCVEAPELREIYVFNLSSISTPATSPPHSPHITLHTNELVTCSCWVDPRCLATATLNSVNVDLWDIGSHLDALTRDQRSLYGKRNIYSPARTVSNEEPAHCMGTANGLLITGDGNGCVRVLDLKNDTQLQKFRDHRGKITDLYVDRFRVLSCSADFSIRVYRWLREAGHQAQLQSRYTLLGGSVVLKNHAGFSRILCESSSCVGVAGNQLKVYTFATNLQSSAS